MQRGEDGGEREGRGEIGKKEDWEMRKTKRQKKERIEVRVGVEEREEGK